jgi:hypothetical protein
MACRMYTQLVTPVPAEQPKSRFNSRQVLAAACIVALGLCAVLFAVGEQAGEEDSVRNLLLATKASTSQLAAIKKKVQLMSPKQQMLYDSGMEDEAHKAMHIAYQTFMKAKDEGVLTEYDDLNATITEEQDALVDYADEMAAIQLEVENEEKEHAAQYDPQLPSE